MRLAQSLAAVFLATGSLAFCVAAPHFAFAQSAEPDDGEDDEEEAPEAAAPDDDDAEVPDPDDPAGDGVGSDAPVGGSTPEAADDDGAGDDDAGTPVGAPGSGDDDDDDAPAGSGGGSGGNAAVDDDDDDDSPGSAPAPASAGPDDDDDAGDDDVGGRTSPSPSGGNAQAGGDDRDDDDSSPVTSRNAGGDDSSDRSRAGAASDDDDDNNGSETSIEGESSGDDDVQFTGGGEESETERIAQDEKDGIETDREGFRYRRSEFVALDLDARDIAGLRSRGFTIMQTERLARAGGTVHLVKGPTRMADKDAFDLLDDFADPGSLSYNHLFDSSSGEVRKVRARAAPARPACGCQVGMVDTGVATRLPLFRHVSLEQRAFNARQPAPRLHGTAVAHLFAGNSAQRGRPTRIIVADIFSGARATAGSTFALVRALDWLGTRGVTVINVSLAGPRNPVVAAAVDRMVRRGHVIVAAAGNDGPAAPPVFPGAYSGVVAVTAVDERQQIYRYANRGSYIDFSAHGVSVSAINPQGQATAATGTSFAAPVVAVRLARELNRPDPLASARAISRLEREARDLGSPGRDAIFGHGLVVDAR